VTKTAVVDGYDVRVGLKDEVAVGVCPPTLGDVACVAVDLKALECMGIVIELLKLTVYHDPSRFRGR
jgi:hypothetical protein